MELWGLQYNLQVDRVILYITLREGMKRRKKEGKRKEGRMKKRKEGRAFCYISSNYFKKRSTFSWTNYWQEDELVSFKTVFL